MLFLSALTEPVDKVRGFAVGAVDFISKPLHPEEVLARVRTHVQLRALQRSLEEKNELLAAAVALRQEVEAQLQRSLEAAVVVATVDDGCILFRTVLAQRLLGRYFPGADDPGVDEKLPSPLAAWAASATAGPFRVKTEGGRLAVRLFSEHPGGNSSAATRCSLLLLEETRAVPAPSPADLLPLGLTPREAEVLFWVAEGKSGPEVAIILGQAINTTRKHMSNILQKLGVVQNSTATLQTSHPVASAWNARLGGGGNSLYTLTPEFWTSTIPVKGSINLGFTFLGKPPQTPSALTLNGQNVPIQSSVPPPPPTPTSGPNPTPTPTPTPAAAPGKPGISVLRDWNQGGFNVQWTVYSRAVLGSEDEVCGARGDERKGRPPLPPPGTGAPATSSGAARASRSTRSPATSSLKCCGASSRSLSTMSQSSPLPTRYSPSRKLTSAPWCGPDRILSR